MNIMKLFCLKLYILKSQIWLGFVKKYKMSIYDNKTRAQKPYV